MSNFIDEASNPEKEGVEKQTIVVRVGSLTVLRQYNSVTIITQTPFVVSGDDIDSDQLLSKVHLREGGKFILPLAFESEDGKIYGDVEGIYVQQSRKNRVEPELVAGKDFPH